jgi:hypothetical protein
MRRIVAAAGVIVLFSAPAGAGAQGEARIAFLSPKDGATVAGPKVLVRLQVTGFSLVEAGSKAAGGEGHLHLFVDRDPAGGDQTIPADQPNILHLGRPPFDEREVTLSNGQHVIHAEIANSSHTTFHQPATAKITVRVAPGFRGRGALEPACAEVASGTGEVRLVFPTGGGTMQGRIDSKCGFTTEGGDCSWQAVSRRRIDGAYDARTKALTGTVTGTTTRKLMSGPRDRCGRDETSSIPAEPFVAAFDGSEASGQLGQARFAARADPSVTLAETPAPAASAAPTPVRTAAPAKKTGAAIPIVAVVVGVAVLAAIGVRLRRRPARPATVTQPAPAATEPPPPPMRPRESIPPAPSVPATPSAPPEPVSDGLHACSNCGADVRESSRFCTRCGTPQ